MTRMHSAEVLVDAEEAMFAMRPASSMRVLLGVAAGGAVVLGLAWERVAWPWLATWYCALLCVQLVRIIVADRWGHPSSGRSLKQRVRLTAIAALASGSTQALSLGFFPYMEGLEQALHSLILMAIVNGAVIYTAGHPRIYGAYMAPIIASLAVAWFTRSLPTGDKTWLGPVFGMLMLYYGFVLRGFAKDVWGMFLNAAAMRRHEQLQNVQLAEAAETARAASRAKTRFLAAASHDLRQPIHTIALLTGVLKLRHGEGSSADVLKLLTGVVTSLSSQLDDLLDISKLDAGVVHVKTEPLSLSHFLRQRFEEIHHEASAKGLTPKLQLTEGLTVLSDPALLQRVIRNLLSNAVKFTSAGSVSLSLFREGSKAVITVSDTGCGIAPENHRLVFQEFLQLDNPERDRTKGLGLGLSIVDRLCRLMGFGLQLSSTLGVGTVVELQLPIVEICNTNANTTRMPDPAIPLNLCVLVLDDEAAVRQAMRLLLEELGCRCLEAEDTASSLRIARSCRPDFVLADHRLRGDEDGVQAIRMLREVYPDLPAVIVSGDIGPTQLQAMSDSGLRLVHKPVALETLLEILAGFRPSSPHQK